MEFAGLTRFAVAVVFRSWLSVAVRCYVQCEAETEALLDPGLLTRLPLPISTRWPPPFQPADRRSMHACHDADLFDSLLIGLAHHTAHWPPFISVSKGRRKSCDVRSQTPGFDMLRSFLTLQFHTPPRRRTPRQAHEHKHQKGRKERWRTEEAATAAAAR